MLCPNVPLCKIQCIYSPLRIFGAENGVARSKPALVLEAKIVGFFFAMNLKKKKNLIPLLNSFEAKTKESKFFLSTWNVGLYAGLCRKNWS